MAKVDFRQTELHVISGNRDVAPGDDGKSAAEHPTIDFGNYRLGHFAQDLIAPLARFLADLIAHTGRLGIHLDKILLQILPGAETLAGPGDDDHARLFVVAQIVQAVVHLAMQLRAHRVAFFRTIQCDRRYAVFVVNQQSLISGHGRSSQIFRKMIYTSRSYSRYDETVKRWP